VGIPRRFHQHARAAQLVRGDANVMRLHRERCRAQARRSRMRASPFTRRVGANDGMIESVAKWRVMS
jgi:hypothetical protein